ncbi:TPA: hypothetical protein QCW30_005029 [Bacillus cereus]|uniref:DUF6414 family protein n=1 Tax=Bacillus TaxID=1386 RepID=UPI0007F97430|nr:MULTISPECIES: DUF6414 family protein [Bacillus cereus group]ARV91096.1 hypothetical protein BJG91_01860 [Bacillus thuringiensis]MEB9660281.1 DUF6414 family protein [Bacillus cereus]MRB36680.1 hypothetical protein [Bacillus thuringiensis]OTY27814.1 hypothetical protein BK738_11970 [Bacillus thuringiensis serovar rongseni]HDR7138654.1 hypothetical protein [Bacillus cereus]
MQKIIYFDEGSATDMLQIEYGGQIVSVDEDKGTVHFGGKAQVGAEVGAGTNFFTAIKAAFTAKVNVDSSFSKDSLVTKTISNTILADFYKLSNKLKEDKKIFIFKNFQIRPIKNSFSFLKMYTPYIKIIKEDSALVEEMKDFDVQNFDEILKNARGYYELLAYKDNDRIILRFNINALKNAYSLMDLPKMKLTYYAVEVGESEEEDFIIENEMNVEKVSERPSVSELMGDSDCSNQGTGSVLKMYDVILAGVEVGTDEN